MFSNKSKLKYLRSIWGKELDKFRNLDLIASYHNLLKEKDKSEFVDDKTWNDLELSRLFAKMDRNLTGIGQQYLFHLLHKYEEDNKKLELNYSLIMKLKKEQNLRELIQLKLYGLGGVSSYFIPYLILEKDLPRAKYYFLFYIFSALSILSAALIAVNGVFFFVTAGLFLVNLVLNKVFSGKIYEYFSGFSSLNSLILSAISLTKLSIDEPIEPIELLKEKKTLMLSLKKKLGNLVIDKESLNDLALIAIEYLNMFLLFDIIAYYRSVNTLLKHQDEIGKIYEAVGKLDASISIASYLEGLPYYSNPEFHPHQQISFKNLYHPLIKNAVPNTLEDLKNSALITGSNMAGKTTFIQTIGINIILSQTVFISLAESFCVPKLFVKAIIKREEKPDEGKSYFFAEIEEIKNFIALSQTNNKYLFLIDEIFRGTNTIERLASSTAVLKYLDKQNFVFVTTHDVELQELLENTFKMFHFSEQVDGDKYFFNYEVQKGPCASGNAIKLLEIMKYPESITNEAKTMAGNLLKQP